MSKHSVEDKAAAAGQLGFIDNVNERCLLCTDRQCQPVLLLSVLPAGQ